MCQPRLKCSSMFWYVQLKIKKDNVLKLALTQNQDTQFGFSAFGIQIVTILFSISISFVWNRGKYWTENLKILLLSLTERIENVKYRRDLKSGHIRILNGPKEICLQMFQFLNGLPDLS